MLKRLMGEFLGTFALLFCGTGAIIVNEETHGMISQTGIALVFGLIVMAMILSLGHVSGAHINPAVTIGLTIAGRFNWKFIMPYIGAQLGGAYTATCLLKYLFPANEFLGASIPRGSSMQSLVLESILTFLLMLVILLSGQKKDHSLLIPALAVGATVGLEALFAGPICGASMNPARSISPALVTGHFEFLWIYILGPLTGVITAAIVYTIITDDEVSLTV
jgi:aquaporin NIP